MIIHPEHVEKYLCFHPGVIHITVPPDTKPGCGTSEIDKTKSEKPVGDIIFFLILNFWTVYKFPSLKRVRAALWIPDTLRNG